MIEYNTIICDDEKNISLTLRRICVDIFFKYSFCGKFYTRTTREGRFFFLKHPVSIP